MPSQIKRLELQLTNNELVGVGMEGGDVGLDAVFFEHVEEGGFAGVVEAEEKDFGIFVVEPERGEGVVEPVDEEHGLLYYIVGCVGVVL